MNQRLYDLELRDVLAEANKLGALKVLTELGLIKPYLTKAQSYRMYGKRVIEKWIKQGLITVRQDEEGANWRLDRNELQALAASRTIANYINQKK